MTLSVIEHMIAETDLGQPSFYDRLRAELSAELEQLSADSQLLQHRYERFRRFGAEQEREINP